MAQSSSPGPTVTHKGTAALFPSLLFKAVSCNAGPPEPILGEKPTHLQRWVDWVLSTLQLSLLLTLPSAEGLAAPGWLGNAGTKQCQGWVCCFLQVIPSHCGLSLTQDSSMSLLPTPWLLNCLCLVIMAAEEGYPLTTFPRNVGPYLVECRHLVGHPWVTVFVDGVEGQPTQCGTDQDRPESHQVDVEGPAPTHMETPC